MVSSWSAYRSGAATRESSPGPVLALRPVPILTPRSSGPLESAEQPSKPRRRLGRLRPRISRKQKDAILALAVQGNPQGEIAQMVGVSRSTVNVYLNEPESRGRLQVLREQLEAATLARIDERMGAALDLAEQKLAAGDTKGFEQATRASVSPLVCDHTRARVCVREGASALHWRSRALSPHARQGPRPMSGPESKPLAAASVRLCGKPGRPRGTEALGSGRAALSDSAQPSRVLTDATCPERARLLDVEAAAAYLSVSTWTIRDLEAAGELQRVRLPLPGHREVRRLLYDVRDLDRLVEGSKDGPAPGGRGGRHGEPRPRAISSHHVPCVES